jgi:hypothetical protein
MNRLDRLIFVAEPAGRLRAVRIGLALVIAWRIAGGPFRELAEQPDALFQPVALVAWLDSVPPVVVVAGIQVLGLLAAALVVLGRRERGAFAVAWSSLLFLGALRASRGKIQHNDLLLLWAAAAVLLAPTGQRLLDRTRSWRHGWPVHTAMAVIASIYFLTGIQKVVTSGPAWVFSDNLQNVMYLAQLSGRAPTDLVSSAIAEHLWVAQLMAAGTLVIELGFPLILVWPRCRPFFVVAAVAMHNTIWLTHGLDYTAWWMTVAVVLVDWSAVAVWWHGRRDERRATRPETAVDGTVSGR